MNLIKLIRNKYFLVFFMLSCFGFLWLFFQSHYENEILLHSLYRSVKLPDHAKVMEQYNRMMGSELKSKEIDSLHQLVKILKRVEKKEEVITVLNRMVEMMPEDRDLRLGLALDLHNHGKYLEAERHFVILLKEKINLEGGK